MLLDVMNVYKLDTASIWGLRCGWRSWLRHCATSRNAAGSIPGGHWILSLTQSFWLHCGPGVDSASNRNEYQDCFLAVKVAGA
jgi:hypothetical protein